MIDMKKIMNLTKEQQLDIIKCKVEVARKAYTLAADSPEEVKESMRKYLKEAEDLLEKASWGLK